MAYSTQYGKVEKTGINLTVRFSSPFVSEPSVVITGFWDGGSTGVERPDILHDVKTTSFTVHSENKTPPGGKPYYINWMARGEV